ncbi:hypothetical protein D1B31_12435 [Neobacillus notoginsengisoli]|uniref:DUF2127 domain-containing protein n=1 Tax=Neobacillus notoginsengisoli TaxID=1578198 RepID=A0A417YTH2_9BACI|nr:hypothetical protein [Neobacillus notoginsengisoli]RHW40352.1 hypothetical protein D1B31_12435 [Neobacillus notoginsengisoli]
MSFLQKKSWILLLLIQVLMLIISISGENGPVGEGSVLHAYLTNDQTDAAIELKLRGSLVIGMTIFGIAILTNAYRKGLRWSWYACWVYPLFFILHIIGFGTFMPDIIFLLLSLAALLLPYRTFFQNNSD